MFPNAKTTITVSFHLQHLLSVSALQSLNNGGVWVKRFGRFSLWIHSCWGTVILLFVFPHMGLSFFILICWKLNNLAVNTFLASLLYDTNGRIFFFICWGALYYDIWVFYLAVQFNFVSQPSKLPGLHIATKLWTLASPSLLTNLNERLFFSGGWLARGLILVYMKMGFDLDLPYQAEEAL